MATLSLQNITKSFGSASVLQGIDLAIKDKEFVVFVGPSGCGKSTLLRIIAGLELATSGQIVIEGTDVSALAPVDRGIPMVFQSTALYPHLTVRENTTFPLREQKLPGAEVKSKVAKAAGIPQLNDKLQLKPGPLSGGQRQRIVVLSAGRVAQFSTPMALYHHPATRFVATFIGQPNVFHLDQLRLGLEAGVQVFTEKPVVISIHETQELARLLSLHDGANRAMVGLVLRYFQHMVDLRTAMKAGLSGQIVSLKATEHIDPCHGACFMRVVARTK